MAILLLQGPLGPFFNNLSMALTQHGQTVFKIHFNGGDEFFYSQKNATSFTGSVHEWSDYLKMFVELHAITCIFTYGDCRHYHYVAKRACQIKGIKYFAFEEGYLRPNYITFEAGGVNGYSPTTYAAIQAYNPIHEVADESKIESNFFRRMAYAAAYYNLSFFKRLKFPKYKHHRSFSPAYEAFCWWRGFFRKGVYSVLQSSAKEICERSEFFLVPLQVHNDAQIKYHSQYESIQDFIVDVLTSFSKSGSSKALVFKHHPMDRGHVNYAKLIRQKAVHLNIHKQVSYIHDQHLPTLLKACEGVVTINSTTALQAFYHNAPVLVVGYAFFDMPGLTYQGGLLSFWKDPVRPNIEFTDKFRAYILDHGQVNGSFYTANELTLSNLITYIEKLGVLVPKDSSGLS
jgi:capsular polysaccharide export protein